MFEPASKSTPCAKQYQQRTELSLYLIKAFRIKFKEHQIHSDVFHGLVYK